jgi:hypothetical protein
MNAHRAQQGEAGESWAKIYNLRAGIEGTISQAARGPDLRHSRYRGLAKAHVQNVLIGIAVNITRLGAHFTANGKNDQTEESQETQQPRRSRPPTRIHQLCLDHGLVKPQDAAAA